MIQTNAAFTRFRSSKRGYYSFLFILLGIFFALSAELFCSNRALFVNYQGHWYFPSYGDPLPGKVFGEDYDYETNYRELKEHFNATATGNWLILPLIPYGPYESDFSATVPSPPDMQRRHILGTDSAGRDITARLLYGFRLGLTFAILLALFEYMLGMGFGLLMGYCGGWWDLIGQRLVEIWDNIPILYIVIILAAIFNANFWSLLAILICFGWMARTQTMRALTLREKAKDYVESARALGFSSLHIMFKEILPNTLPLMLSFLPFTIEASFTALTIYDFLGFGLPVPTPSWGELLKQGMTQVHTAPWIAFSVVSCLIMLLVSITFVGEALRDALDPKRHARYF